MHTSNNNNNAQMQFIAFRNIEDFGKLPQFTQRQIGSPKFWQLHLTPI